MWALEVLSDSVYCLQKSTFEVKMAAPTAEDESKTRPSPLLTTYTQAQDLQWWIATGVCAWKTDSRVLSSTYPHKRFRWGRTQVYRNTEVLGDFLYIRTHKTKYHSWNWTTLVDALENNNNNNTTSISPLGFTVLNMLGLFTFYLTCLLFFGDFLKITYFFD